MKSVHFVHLFMQSANLFQDPDLIWDLRVNNNGRPVEYTQFLEECQKYIDGVLETAVDERRHDQTVEEGLSICF